jgi:hypothetical protein
MVISPALAARSAATPTVFDIVDRRNRLAAAAA